MPDSPSSPPGENRLLSVLPPDELERLRPHLEPVTLSFRENLYRPNERISHVYFPCSAICSLVLTLEGGATVEVGTVGNEGMLGLHVFLGAGSVPGQSYCQIPGRALRLPAEILGRETADGGPLHDLLQRYAQALMNLISQSAACNRGHSIDERCARWLLMTHDRVGADRFPLTQQFLAQMLGVRRAGVNAAASILQRAGFIRYSRGVITVTDRPGLESAACACYRTVRDEFERLLR